MLKLIGLLIIGLPVTLFSSALIDMSFNGWTKPPKGQELVAIIFMLLYPVYAGLVLIFA